MGFNMSWIFADGIDQDVLYAALDLVPTAETADHTDLGTSHLPWAGATLKTGWCAVFAKYSLVMDVAAGTVPPRLTRLPAKSRCVMCVVLEHAMISYASLWHGGRYTWVIRHGSDQGVEHLEASGDLPPEFAGLRDSAMDRQRTHEERRRPGTWGVDHVFNVPLDTAAAITGYRHNRVLEDDFFTDLRTLVLAGGNVPTRLSQPPTWWQKAGSIKYE